MKLRRIPKNVPYILGHPVYLLDSGPVSTRW